MLSTLGYGFVVIKFLNMREFSYNYGLIGILGLFLLSIISSYTHLIFPHNFSHNLIIYFAGLVSFIFFNKKNTKELKYTLLIFFLIFVSILMSKTNEDFGYYHLPNTLQFSEQKLQFGLGNLNHGFKHISSLFMIMSLKYLPLFKYYLFNLTNLLFLIFFITFLLKEIYLRSRENLNLSNVILSLFLVLFLTKFSRLAEYGSDISSQIIVSMYFFFILELFYNDRLRLNKKISYFKLALILIVFAFTLKFISIIYSVLILACFFLIKEKKEILFKLFNVNFISIIFLSSFIFIFLNFASTGCLIYPIEKFCFSDSYNWTLSNDLINYLNFHYETWSKGGIGPDLSVQNKEDYILYLNWLPNWFNVYFLGKVTDYLLVTFVITLIFTFFYYKEIFLIKKKSLIKGKKNFILYLCLMVIFLMWFFNFPTLRYSGYIIVFLISIYPFATLIEKKINFSEKNILKKFTIMVCISYSIFLYKNISRINNELSLTKENHHNFYDFPFYWVEKKDFEEIILNNHKLYLTKGSCWNVPSTCVRHTTNLKISKKNSYIFYSNK
ncbi:hypothetical protein OA418_04095 [Candidatus Pelagibacter sp.]|nr:hypothetical protein [Candidatus Pelagibacter sp.]